MNQPELLNTAELVARTGYSRAQFDRLQKQGKWKFLETTRPVGTRIYSKAKVDAYLAGESTSQFGRKSA